MPREFSEWEWDAQESAPEGLRQAEQVAMEHARENEAWVVHQTIVEYEFDGWFVRAVPFAEHSAFGNSFQPRAWRGWELRASYSQFTPEECWDFLGRIERDASPTREEAQTRLEDFLANCE